MSKTEIQTPINGISIFKDNHCSEEPSIYTLTNKNKFSLSKVEYIVKNSKGAEVINFDCNIFTGKSIINDLRNNSKYKYKYKNGLLEDKIIFYQGEEEDESEEIQVKIKIANKIVGIMTYEVNFYNKIIDKEETFLVSLDALKFSYKIFYGNKENSPVICTFKRTNILSINYEAEIAPNVDEIFILALCLNISYITKSTGVLLYSQ